MLLTAHVEIFSVSLLLDFFLTFFKDIYCLISMHYTNFKIFLSYLVVLIHMKMLRTHPMVLPSKGPNCRTLAQCITNKLMKPHGKEELNFH